MHLVTRNVNTAFRSIVTLMSNRNRKVPTFDGEYSAWKDCPTVRRPSRNGNVLMIDEPVTVTYTHPRERVLFNAVRDANPFSLLYEALWMLAGRNDVAPLAYYTKRFTEYSDDGKTLNGAYGRRWRHSWDGDGRDPKNVDQLDLLVAHLKAEPNSRRAVLAMWNVEDDLLKIGKTINPESEGSRDCCCNLNVMFSLRPGEYDPEEAVSPNTAPPGRPTLDITVTNRSNDLVWGMLGADYATFSFLQEYVAARVGAEVGRYHHFTNNLHAYGWNWKPEEWLAAEETLNRHTSDYRERAEQPSPDGPMKMVPLVRDPETFEAELPKLVETFSGDNPERKTWTDYSEPFFKEVAVPALTAFGLHKSYRSTSLAVEECRSITADDWRIACAAWLERRVR